jgi:hypothetical protein
MADEPQDDRTISALLGRLKESGESAFNSLSAQLLENPTFLAALRRALEAKGQVDRTVSGTLDLVNLPSKNDVTRILEALESLGAQLARQQRSLAALEQAVARIEDRLAAGPKE